MSRLLDVTLAKCDILNAEQVVVRLIGSVEQLCELLLRGCGYGSVRLTEHDFTVGGCYRGVGNGRDGTEIDIFESDRYEKILNHSVTSNLHFDGYNEAHQKMGAKAFSTGNNPYEEYNTYGLEWNENEYIFYINGVETGRLSTGGVSQNPEYLILSCEIAGENGVANADRNGTGKINMKPGDTAEFIVDYVRVYQYK